MTTTTRAELTARWRYLTDGATLAANLVHVAREGTMEHVAAALATMTPQQVEAATFAMVLIHAEGHNVVDEDEAAG